MKIHAWHVIVLVIVILVVFGSARLPQIAESVGKSLKIFKKEIKELREDDEPATTDGTTGAEKPSDPAS